MLHRILLAAALLPLAARAEAGVPVSAAGQSMECNLG
jgi:hypothetical protein